MRYKILRTVMTEASIEADNKEEALALFNNHLSGTSVNNSVLIDKITTATSTVTTEKTLVDGRNPECVKAWSDCGSFLFDPRCCRFPKSCSAGVVYWKDKDDDTD